MDTLPFGAIGVGVMLFAAANVDDILLLAAFFSNPRIPARAIVMGQFAGIAALVAVSTAAALAAVIVPPAWIALIGIVPLVLGVRKLWELRRHRQGDDETDATRDNQRFSERHHHSQALAVAGVTIANGGDNLGVYIPVFGADVYAIPTYVGVFVVMTTLWCVAGYALVNNRVLGRHIRRYGHVPLPYVLIGLGIMILRDAAPLLR